MSEEEVVQTPVQFCTCKPGEDNPQFQVRQDKLGFICLFCNMPRNPNPAVQAAVPVEPKPVAPPPPPPPPPKPKQLGMDAMTLRDWFAGQALCIIKWKGSVGEIAEQTYKLADAMIAERKKEHD